MKVLIFFSVPFLLLLLLHTFPSAHASIVEESCRKAWNEAKSYERCVEMFKANPKSDKADKRSLLEIAANITVAQLRANQGIFAEEKKKGNFSQHRAADFDGCIESFYYALKKMDQVMPGYDTGDHNNAGIYASGAMDAISSCVDDFSRSKNRVLKDAMDKVVRMIHQVNKFSQL